ncbi:MAG: hypothetical protein UW65_C0022G0015 [candidate division WWE3 bacterium GW2011_GWB1_44_4]|uniref:Uncharacterized protein n=2 Tax=Katanobacteria TaxID=422282 RepID=A0A0G1KL93_UNCKA|nr:MAG: hypothetical protein UW65_C0022G0015 [candidate division WWE3 bacterium GW2011_GWB1_44_4]KKT84501.1 MAG: hypothetical protein UW82_C0019G0002 [candidate division WWE3 bacterium GW2011_GWC2_44_9]
MRKDRNNLLYLKDILEAINFIEIYILDAPDMEDFIKEKGLYQDWIDVAVLSRVFTQI